MQTSDAILEQIARALRQAKGATLIVEIRRKLEVTVQALLRCRKKVSEAETPDVREVRQLRNEHKMLKQIVADLILDKTILQEFLRNVVSSAHRRMWACCVQKANATFNPAAQFELTLRYRSAQHDAASATRYASLRCRGRGADSWGNDQQDFNSDWEAA